jgi:hypothetical protein
MHISFLQITHTACILEAIVIYAAANAKCVHDVLRDSDIHFAVK